MVENITPGKLILRLLVYYVVFVVAVAGTLTTSSDALTYLPFGGQDALEVDRSDIEVTETSIRVPRELVDAADSPAGVTSDQVIAALLFLFATLITTVLVMIPVTWTYRATRFDAGPSKNFVRALILLPICAATVVLLIQDSLALAFGLAALVAAVRFRVSLSESVDGIYIFAAVCVGLAAGIGYMGIALIMSLIFTLAAAVMWKIDYGRNPIDDRRHEAAVAKLDKKLQPGDG